MIANVINNCDFILSSFGGDKREGLYIIKASLINCVAQPYNAYPKYWGAIDSGYAFMYCSTTPPISNLPYFANG
jgi:hypothetical protein